MAEQPLSPFQSPAESLSHLGLSLPSLNFLILAFAFIFVLWLLYTAVATYHWARYSHASSIAIPAVLIHIIVSLTLLTYAFTILLYS